MNDFRPQGTAVAGDRRAELADLTGRFVDAFNRGDIDDVMSFFTEDAVYEDAYGGRHAGLTAIRAAFEPLLNGRRGRFRFEEEDLFVDPDNGKVMDSWRLSTHMGEPEETTMRGLDLLHFQGDKITRKRTYKQD